MGCEDESLHRLTPLSSNVGRRQKLPGCYLPQHMYFVVRDLEGSHDRGGPINDTRSEALRRKGKFQNLLYLWWPGTESNRDASLFRAALNGSYLTHSQAVLPIHLHILAIIL
jgi:hypothetical protein